MGIKQWFKEILQYARDVYYEIHYPYGYFFINNIKRDKHIIHYNKVVNKNLIKRVILYQRKMLKR